MVKIKATDVALASFYGVTRQTISKLRNSKKKEEIQRYNAFFEHFVKFFSLKKEDN